ncbi:glycosyltransferase family 2 protein [Cellulomonas endometrii]|uniref:glycosyltransferase family 2 protein n=1 Tax=Cellulomonas endometrii TaxID=3036301 RepID=UPI0024AE83CE|nr:glycosyltransferase [Cellulomonas endometrii]
MTDEERPGPGVEDARVTFVVMSRDRRDELVQSLGRHRAPVILVDNGSTDGTAAAVRAAHPHVRVVEAGRNLGAAARTLGVRLAETPYVAFADDDSWWAPGSLALVADVLDADPDVAVVQARVLVGPEERPDPFNDVLAASPLPRPPRTDLPTALGFMACAAIVRRDAFLAAGGFDDVVRFPGEEERLALDLAAAGHAIVHAPQAVVHHHPSPRRHSPGARVTAATRSHLLTAILRLPWRDVARDARSPARTPPRRRRLAAPVRDLRALRERRVTPPRVLSLRALLDAPPAAGPTRHPTPPTDHSAVATAPADREEPR